MAPTERYCLARHDAFRADEATGSISSSLSLLVKGSFPGKECENGKEIALPSVHKKQGRRCDGFLESNIQC